jgi:hypothetical protein
LQHPSTLPAAEGSSTVGDSSPRAGWLFLPSRSWKEEGSPAEPPMRAHLRRLVCGLALVLAATGCEGKLTGKPGDGDAPGGGTPEPPEIPVTPWEAVAPPVYLAKVKNLLTGVPPTPAELAAVTADPTALEGLVDGWLASPEGQAKLRVFFMQAFQQTQITKTELVDQIGNGDSLDGNGAAQTALVANIKESVARTALAWTASGRPFNELARTRELHLTTALMSYLAFIDARGVTDRGSVNDRYYLSLPAAERPDAGFTVRLGVLTGAVDPTNLETQVWGVQPATPDAGTFPGCPTAPNSTTRAIRPRGQLSRDLFNLLLGRVPDDPTYSGSGTLPCRAFNTAPQFLDTDFTDWREVTMRAPGTGEAPTVFWDLATLRNRSEVVVTLPRVGFFTTPAFFANWQTNGSNQHRVSMNQTLIVALGKSFDGNGSTVPISENGLDEEHASDPACYACHRTLDPMRQFFRQSFTVQYGLQTDAGVVAQNGEFAFDGVTATGAGRGALDLADQLATHPRFATAWAQKVCTWADSAPCSEDDPEFLRVAKAFRDSNHDFRVLARQMLSSPLVTGTAATRTFTDRGYVVSIARADHLCAALASRLGLQNACQVNGAARSLSGTLPADAYSRGAEAPVLTADTSLFFRSITENLCRTLADQVVDVGTTPRFSSKNPTAAVEDMVRSVMVLVDGDPRQSGATTILNEHYAAAVKAGATARDSLKSTFVLACSSPTAVSMGL